jgi:hypothetical protein
MLALLGASALVLSGLQASIAAPTTAFRGCLHDSAAKGAGEKVAADAIDGYLRQKCTVQLDALKSALVAFRVKNGMTRTEAAKDAQMTIDDYVATSADNYKFIAEQNAPKPDAAPAAQQPSSQPHN